MINMSYEEIVSKIEEQTSMEKPEIDAKIKDKVNMLSGLVSKEGAAYIIANEMGIKLVDLSTKSLKINNISEGLRNMHIVGKVLRLYDLREFQVSGRSGKVRSAFIGDDTGTTRLTLWNDEASLLDDAKEGDILDINGINVRKNNGRLELHSYKTTTIKLNPEGVTLEVKNNFSQSSGSNSNFESRYKRKMLKDITLDNVGEYAKVTGVIVNAFDPIFFNLCPHCRHKVYQRDGGYYCEQHNLVSPMESCVCSIMIDDGTDVMRVSLWKKQVDEVGKDNIPSLIGMQKTIGGKINKNYQSDKVEMSASFMSDPNPDEELKFIQSQGE